MHPADTRIVELSVIGLHRPLTVTEAREWAESREYVKAREWRRASIFNRMLAARIGKDWAWFNQIGDELQRFRRQYGEVDTDA